MNALIHLQSGYLQSDASLRPLRTIEYDAFSRVTQRLASTWRGRKADFPALVQALNDNLRLWSTLAADVASSENRLPPGLRAQIFYLYEFSEHHTRKVLGEGSGVDVLIDVNAAVMRGLRGHGDVR